MIILEEFEASAWSDYRVALQGRFERGVMVRAVECLVEDVVEDRGGVLVPVLTKHQNSPVTHTRQLRRDTDFGLEPTLRDPYESNMVEIGGSNIDGANEGLFARQDIEINTVVAFYNGTKARLEDYEPDTWETNNYKIFDPDDMPDGTIDIPVWAQVGLPCLSLSISSFSPGLLGLLCHPGSQDEPQLPPQLSVLGVRPPQVWPGALPLHHRGHQQGRRSKEEL